MSFFSAGSCFSARTCVYYHKPVTLLDRLLGRFYYPSANGKTVAHTNCDIEPEVNE